MEIIDVTPENIGNEHICCAITDKKGENCVVLKKSWMKERFDDGLVFKKLNARGKVFIEYIPAEKAWCPICADGYMHIGCFWVSGRYKGQGYANRLLESCIEDVKAKGGKGLTVLSSPKKMPFLSDPGYLKYKGFRVADKAGPYFELLYLPFAEGAVPRFRDAAKRGHIEDKGLVLYYSDQCPFAGKYADLIAAVAESRGRTLKKVKITTAEEAQAAPSPFTVYSFFDGGVFVTNEILSEKKFEKYLDTAPSK